MNIATPPIQLLDLVANRTIRAERNTTLDAGLPAVGSRNMRLASLAGSLRRKGLRQDLIAGALLGFNQLLPDPLPQAEVERIAESISRYDPALDLTEVKLSEKFAERNYRRIRYSPKMGWMYFNGHHWSRDLEGLEAQELVKEMLAELRESVESNENLDQTERAGLTKAVKGLLRQSPIKNIQRLAASAPNILDKGEWDVAPKLLNFQNGTLKLPSRELYPHDPNDRIMKILPYEYDANARCPTFERVLADTLEPDVAEYLRRLFGYALQGTAEEHVFPILTGAGRNGKSTVVEAIAYAFGPYATTAEPSTFMKTTKQSINNDLASLAGSRLVRISETNQGELLDTALIKRLTGGDTLKARFLYKEHFEFSPTALPIMITNMPPVFDGSDHAIVRRLQMIRFGNVIPEDKIDPQLPQKLKEEVAGIMNWMLEGLADYVRAGGLSVPSSVRKETDRIVNDSNPIRLFLDECCEFGPDERAGARDLFHQYVFWASDRGLRTMSEPAFRSAVQRNTGLEQRRFSQGVFWIGVGIRKTQPE